MSKLIQLNSQPRSHLCILGPERPTDGDVKNSKEKTCDSRLAAPRKFDARKLLGASLPHSGVQRNKSCLNDEHRAGLNEVLEREGPARKLKSNEIGSEGSPSALCRSANSAGPPEYWSAPSTPENLSPETSPNSRASRRMPLFNKSFTLLGKTVSQNI